MVYWEVMDSPIGEIEFAALEGELVYCASARESGSDMFDWLDKYLPDEEITRGKNKVLEEATSQLEAFLLGESKKLDVPLKLIGTPFRIEVWQALRTIPFGETRSYGELAKQIGKPGGARAIGQANNKNPISYFVP